MRTITITLLAMAGVAASAQTYRGVLEVSFGHCTTPWGESVSMKGLKIPYTLEPIKATRANPNGYVVPRKNRGNDGGSPEAVTVYQNDNGDGTYFVNGFGMPSGLDDAFMTPAAVGARWQFLTTGIEAQISDNNDDFLIRWRCYRNFVSGMGHGVSAFYNDPIDFGGRFNFSETIPPTPTPGIYKLTFDLRPPGVPTSVPLTFPQQQGYFAQQFREWAGIWTTGEEPFRPEFSTVFSSGGPTVGTSVDFYYFDADPEEGIYAEDEIDQFDPGNDANFLLKIEAQQTGTVDTRMPSSITQNPGRYVAGALSDIWDSDNFYYEAWPGPVLVSTLKPLQFIIESTSTVETIIALSVQIETKATLANLPQTVELYNFTTSQYVQVDQRNIGTTDGTITVTATGTPSQYVQTGTRKVRARLGYKPAGAVLVYPWKVSIDKVNWLITR